MQGSIGDNSPAFTELLVSVAEQLRIPLTTIARQAELGEITGKGPACPDILKAQTGAALALIDSYLLGVRLMDDRSSLALEPLSIASTLHEIAQELHGFSL